jgi:hypothetical protein
LRWRDAQACGHVHQSWNRARLHLAHHLGSVRLDGDLVDAEFATDLLVQQATDDGASPGARAA